MDDTDIKEQLKQLLLDVQQLNNNKYPQHWAHFIDCVNAYKNKITRVIDVGCGSGIYYKLCKIHFPNIKYFGIDRSAQAISLAMEHWRATCFAQLDYCELSPRYFTDKDLLNINLYNGQWNYAHINHLLNLGIPIVLMHGVNIRKNKEIPRFIINHNYISLFDLADKDESIFNISMVKGL